MFIFISYSEITKAAYTAFKGFLRISPMYVESFPDISLQA